jgi:hypothetical protein
VRVKSINCTGFLGKKTKLGFSKKKKTIHMNSVTVQHGSTVVVSLLNLWHG